MSERPITPRDPAGQAGFSLIEVLVTALITALLASAVATALISQTHASGDQRLRSAADALANQDQDRLRGLTDQALTALVSSGPVPRPVSGTPYTVTSSAVYQDVSGTSSCASNSVDLFNVTSQVSWSEGFHQAGSSVSVNTLLKRPVIGELQTTVDDQTGAGIPGVSVTATPTGTPPSGSSQSGQTDSSGCSLFAGLVAGNYSVAASKAGYVVQPGSGSTQSAAVTSNGITATANFTLGLASALTGTFKASDSTAAPSYPGQADALTYTGSGFGTSSYTATQTNGGAPAASLAASSLFPWNTGTSSAPTYTGNYSLYAGQCSFQNPWAGGGTSANLATVTPGGSATPTVQEPFLYIPTVQANLNGSTFGVEPQRIVLTYKSGSCTDTYPATVASAPATYTGGVGIYPVVPSTGWLTDPGQPYAPSGALTVCAQVTYNGSVYAGSVTTSNTSLSSRNTAPPITLSSNASAPC